MLQENSIGLLQAYRRELYSYDEVIDKNGGLKPHWEALFLALEKLGMDELAVRNQEIITKLQENGVTYSVYEGNDGLNRPWQLDPIPFLIHETEWKEIAKGLQQRAVLLDLILKDLYGPRTLIKNKIIPPELVYQNSGFLRSCYDTRLAGKHQLITYAADIARGPDGRMWVLDNRTQAPSGTGYALENRTMMSSILPDLAESMYVRRLSPYFTKAQASIGKSFGKGKDDLTIVYLTPGPNNETYFEHAYLASYLGYTLVQGDDLLVRDGYVWLKSVEGLRKVDIIIRRVDDSWCDPLELRSDSRLGVPGLLQAMRAGNVTVINPPGVGVVENNAFMAFMHTACRHLLGEELILPSVATWWCGQPKELDYVLQNLPKLIIKKANRDDYRRSIHGKMLSEAALEELKREIKAKPTEFVAQEEVSFSTTPAFVNSRIEPRFAALRAFMISNGNGYEVMSGGLTRSSPERDRFTFSNQYGGIAKDTWIVGDQFEKTRESIVVPPITSAISVPLIRKQASLPSRSADNLFWVGRYGERVLATNTFVNIVLNTMSVYQNYGGKGQSDHITVLLRSLTHLTLTYPGFVDEEDISILESPMPEINSLVLDTSRSGSIGSSLDLFLRAIKSVRDQWNPEIGRAIDAMEGSLFRVRELKKGSTDFRAVQKVLDKLYTRIFTFYGTVSETMARDNAYYLLECGKLIERILSRVSVIRSGFVFKHADHVENELLEAILQYHHLLGKYRTLYRTQVNPVAVMDMILLESNSRFSLVYQLDLLIEYLQKLPNLSQPGRLNPAQKAVLEASVKVKLVDVASICEFEEDSNYRPGLDQLMADITGLVLTASECISNLYFDHVAIQHSLFIEAPQSKEDEI
jgi:uncharacterized circularly permuted ATP-grasp superfamily protein/uncharacterized alpha-E superfamily protein